MRWIASLLLAITLAGCEFLSPIGPIITLGVMWMEGEGHKYYNTDQRTMEVAVKNVLKELKMPVNKESVSGQIKYINAGDDDRFKIKINAVRDNVTKLSIRVNFMGDRPYADMLFRHVDEQPGVRQFATLAKLNEAVK